MKVVIRMTEREELKALPILLRHSVGMMLRDGSYVISAEAARKLWARALDRLRNELEREYGSP